MQVVVVGNGILGLTVTREILRKDSSVRVVLVGPETRPGCASVAAAAMFNSFCEVDAETTGNQFERAKFLFNKSATPLWPAQLKELSEESGRELNYGFGTYLVNNHHSDALEDENFDAVVAMLNEFAEPFEHIQPSEIPNYAPIPSARAARAIYIPSEGWVNPLQLLACLEDILLRSGRVTFVNQACHSLRISEGRVESVILANQEIVQGDTFVLCPGAVFSEIIARSEITLNIPRIFYGVGCSILLRTDENTLSHCVRTPNRGLACGVYAAPQAHGYTVVGASNFISPVAEEHVRLTSIHTLITAAIEQINARYYRAQLVRVNVGWRPTSADTLPLIGKTSIQGLVVATGTKRDGLHCSPVISDHVSDLVLGRTPKLDLSLFRPERPLTRVLTRDAAINTAVRHSINAAYQHGFKAAQGRMVEDLERLYKTESTELHDQVGARDWGIPPEMINMYKNGHIL
jgi:glycine oxidase